MKQPLQIRIPRKAHNWLQNLKYYNVAKGGRGSAKSHTVATFLIMDTAWGKRRVLCTREMQNSIKDSVHRLLVDKIHEYKLQDNFQIHRDSITSVYGSEFLFKGLRHNIQEVKSTEGVDYCWVEEAETVSKYSWDTLIPTIRKSTPKFTSKFFIVFNPEEEKSETYQRFILNPPPGTNLVEMNYMDNPWFPQVLREQMEYDKKVDPEKYEHVWLGKIKKYAEDVIFKSKLRIEEFDPPERGLQLYFGADWGFSVDPSCLVRMFIRDKKLYIEYEAYGVGVEIEELPAFFRTVPGHDKWKIVGDSQRPDTISFMRRKGFNIVGAEKGKGSVEDGIEFLRGFEAIIIHPRCKGAIDNFSNYRWKRDRITQEILPIPLDLNNHVPDACRYALESYIKSKLSIYEVMRRTS